MDSLTNNGVEIELVRTLRHLQSVILQNIRRSESFAMSWAVPADLCSGRASIWFHPAIPVQFRFNGSRVPAINPAWFATLTESADSSMASS
ncbi:DUF7882 family protein [Subtercola lobariae]|uniref:DUF7882 domain-containing protein n=1 Tax=Subtercola lobariae TaxID=1588641 RepID=A0A917B4H6_9MICO|nr:hypothetical protein GCM10011399_15770 [Subtercola lobariae]